ncbi:tRNA dihydrouridine synthase DusB [Symbiobacterium thermophilum]|uniref:tRNA-dihydrouridine synthase n=1 Tax=Symbiobacterium thermophilum (strain DSM 24528 / JCM 14929 / IAM 14863 / T) TaxID=292459 RepID=Q67JL0_SYMTH|nr:putative transcriptional regulator [Symbiobacterium thermophilum IAM 14863]
MKGLSEPLLKPIRLGGLTIERPLALAPMAGVTNWPFRRLCKEHGCGLVVTEFVSDKALLYDSKRTREMIRLLPDERPAGVQLFGADPDTMARAAARVVELEQPDLIDINMGCPAPKVTKGRGGSSLLKEPELAQEIVRRVVQAVAPTPVTVKMRIGWDSRSINAVEVAKRVEEAGARMITVHGRTKEQHYSGRADWGVIAAVARAVSIPVLGNGDIADPREAEARLRTSGVAGLAVGRGALGNPWIFSRTLHYLETGELLPEPGVRERVETALRHLDLMIEYKGEFLAVREMRKHAAWYLKGLHGSAGVRAAVNEAERADDLRALLLGYLDRMEAVAAENVRLLS